ncbi:response regulator [Rhizobiaceae bacterium BDR2-2]|uniref:Response regulator n=1 Tax=Ectorhizobium quercum TaxID=2965071 RepID=A0AAE3MWW0_9HYPH|nr:response regulator [Ectorhizobium quercum]MCX8995921.1 response regulator [Ectorhizobium quercum]
MKTPETNKAPVSAHRVLVIEDDALIGMLYEDVLAEMGHSICAIAQTVTDAVAAAAEHEPDLIIADASLRDGSGVDAVQEIVRHRFVPHLFVSGDRAGVRSRMPDAIIVQKPFLDPDLARAIQKALTAAPIPDR